MAKDVVAEDKKQEAASGVVEFGPVTVRPEGLVVNGRQLSWDNFERFEIENGTCRVFRRRAWFFKSIDVPLGKSRTTWRCFPFFMGGGSTSPPAASATSYPPPGDGSEVRPVSARRPTGPGCGRLFR